MGPVGASCELRAVGYEHFWWRQFLLLLLLLLFCCCCCCCWCCWRRCCVGPNGGGKESRFLERITRDEPSSGEAASSLDSISAPSRQPLAAPRARTLLQGRPKLIVDLLIACQDSRQAPVSPPSPPARRPSCGAPSESVNAIEGQFFAPAWPTFIEQPIEVALA